MAKSFGVCKICGASKFLNYANLCKRCNKGEASLKIKDKVIEEKEKELEFEEEERKKALHTETKIEPSEEPKEAEEEKKEEKEEKPEKEEKAE